MVNLFKKSFIYLALMLFVLISINVESASAAEVDYIEGIYNFRNTPENSAIIGSKIARPEIGWKRYDTYYSKKLLSEPNAPTGYGGSMFYNDSTMFYNNTVTFNFYGSKFRIISAMFYTRSTSLEVSIDGDVIDIFSENVSNLNDNSGQRLVYEKNNLSLGTHVVVIKNLDTERIFEIDAIDVDGKLLAPDEIPNVESITLDKKNLELFEGDSEQLIATVTPKSAQVIWTSSDESVATVDQNGNVTAIKEGVITVTAKVKNTNLTASSVVTVKKQDMGSESITLDKNALELSENSQDKLTATILPENTNKNIVWTSSDESIATVDQFGNVRAIKEGVVTITAQVENTNLTAECIVTVKKLGGIESNSITLDRNLLELIEGSQDKLLATVIPETANVIWSSSDESIATVDQNGNVTAVHEGEAIITAKIENTDISATSTVIVKKPSNESSNAILSITLVNGITKEYDVTNKVLNDYLKWFESAQGTSTFKFTKTISPYKKVTEYIVHDKIASFEVREY
ncbi:Ig-like domain-containing protein [Lysinibacillus xylanilyticus]|uniref:Ig-like domain-containing protein n=1 Tax=Lysinibacillus xylanilyticus TaxID=582475 RepID=UPI003D00DF15